MNRIVAATYTSDNGTDLVVGINEELFDQVNGGAARLVGGSPAPSNVPLVPFPAQGKPRRAKVADAAGYTREIILLEPTAPLATLGTEVNVEDSDGTNHLCASIAVLAESFRIRKQQT